MGLEIIMRRKIPEMSVFFHESIDNDVTTHAGYCTPDKRL